MVNPFSKLNRFQKLLLVLGIGLLAYHALPAVIVILIGLLPTLTILLTDPKNTLKLTIVGCFNLAGVFFCLMNIIHQFDLNQAFYILGNIFNLIIMLGAAALGVIIYYELPNLFLSVSRVNTVKRLTIINNKLQKLSDDWGTDAPEPLPEEKTES